MSPRRFDRYWPHAEPLAAADGLFPARAVAKLRRAVRAGDPAAVRASMAKLQGPRKAFAALQAGFPDASDHPGRRYDELAVARTIGDDSASRYTIYARRLGSGFMYRVHAGDGAAGCREFLSARLLPLQSLTNFLPPPRGSAPRRRVVARLVAAEAGRGFGGWYDHIEEVERGYEGTDYGDPVPCPMCGADPYGPRCDRCDHLMLLWGVGDDISEWGGDWNVPARLGSAICDLHGAVENLTENLRRRLLGDLTPTPLRRAVLSVVVGDESVDDAVRDYLSRYTRQSATYAGCSTSSVFGPPGGTFDIHWDAAALARGHQLDRQLRVDVRCIRRLIRQVRQPQRSS